MYRAAKDKERIGDYSLARQFHMKVLCEPYETPADADSITDRMLTLRSSMAKHFKGVVPDEADRIVVGVDVQGDRCYWVAVASGPRDRRWIFDWDEWFWTAKDEHTGRPIEPQDADRHAVLDRILFKARDGWAKENGDIVKGALIAIDIGFNPNGSIGRWVFGKAGIVAVRGDHEGRVVAETLQGKVNANLGKHNSTLVADHGLYEIRKQEYQAGQPGTWWFVKSQSMREHVSARLRLTYDADGAMMLAKGVAEKDYLIQHLSAWAIVREPESKLVKWVQVRKRDDYADATNYATALLSQQPRSSSRGGVVGSIKAKE
jgi:phage terminase large subunit GpA-like protein